MADDDKDSSPSGIVVEAKERFERAKRAYSSSRLQAVEDTRFCLGDSDNGWQWPEEVRKTRQFDKRVCLTVNLTAQHVNNIVNQIRQNRPSCRVLPVDNGADKKTAEILAGLIRNIQTSSAADDAHDVAAEHSTIGGEGYWRVTTEYESLTSFDQIIRIKPIPNPQLVYLDPMANALEPESAEWGFVFEDVSKEAFKREHPEINPSSWIADKQGWVNEDSFRKAEYFWCEYVKDTALLLEDGSTVLNSKLGEGVTRSGDILTHISGESIQIVKDRPTERRQWKWCKLVGGHEEPVEQTDWIGEYLPIIGVVGKQLNVNGELITKGLVRDIKDPARMVNYSYSETVQTLALQNKVPYMAAAEAIEGYETIWGSANLENRAYLPFNAYDETGQPLPMPQRQAPAVMPAAQVQLLQLSTEEMRAASGQQNSNFGIKSEASSGVGIQRLKAQGEIATFHFPDNLARGLRYEAKILIDLIQKIYDTKRVVRILGLDGQQSSAVLDPNHPQPYSEQDIGEEDIQRIFNPTVGKYDVVIDTGPSFQTQRQESFAALTDMASRNPNFMAIAGDLIMRSADFPMADQLAKRFEKTLPPNLQEQKGGAEQQLAQVGSQLQQAEQHIQLMGQQMQEMAQKLQVAESGQAKSQMEIQSKHALAQSDADIQAQKYQVEQQMAAEKYQSEVEARQHEMLLQNQLEREKAELDAHLAMEKARQDADIKLQIAKMDMESKEEIAELNAYVEMQKIGKENAALSADVNKDLADDVPKKKKTKKVTMTAPSGASYSGTIEEGD
jgi:hypothetical protein